MGDGDGGGGGVGDGHAIGSQAPTSFQSASNMRPWSSVVPHVTLHGWHPSGEARVGIFKRRSCRTAKSNAGNGRTSRSTSGAPSPHPTRGECLEPEIWSSNTAEHGNSMAMARVPISCHAKLAYTVDVFSSCRYSSSRRRMGGGGGGWKRPADPSLKPK